MKNRKKRKLEFIRSKNAIRKGACIYSWFKMSSAFNADRMGKHSFLYMIKEGADLPSVNKKYKLKFKIVDYEISYDSDDFLRDLVTARVKLKAIL